MGSVIKNWNEDCAAVKLSSVPAYCCHVRYAGVCDRGGRHCMHQRPPGAWPVAVEWQRESQRHLRNLSKTTHVKLTQFKSVQIKFLNLPLMKQFRQVSVCEKKKIHIGLILGCLTTKPSSVYKLSVTRAETQSSIVLTASCRADVWLQQSLAGLWAERVKWQNSWWEMRASWLSGRPFPVVMLNTHELNFLWCHMRT